jgi:hypothetical protein
MRERRFLVAVTVAGGLSFARPAPAGTPPTPASPAVRSAPAAAAPVAAVLDVEKTKLTKEQFDRLPDAQVLEFRGERTTVRDLKATFAAAEARRARDLAGLKGRFEEYRAMFLADQKAKVDAQNARALADWERVRARSAVAAPR